MSRILLKRKDIGDCRACSKSPDNEIFNGVYNSCCTHMTSQNGWWLRIDHKFDFFNDMQRLPDKVGNLLCKECLADYNKRVDQFLGSILESKL